MLEYFAYKKAKQHRADKAAALGSQPTSGRDSGRASMEIESRVARTPKPVLTEEDEDFLNRLAEEGPAPGLPERPYVFGEGNEAGNASTNNAQLTRPRDHEDEPAHHHSHSRSRDHENEPAHHHSHSHSRDHEDEPAHHHSHSRSGDHEDEPAHHHSHSHSNPHEPHGSKDKGKQKAEDAGLHRKSSKTGGKFTNRVAALFGKSTKEGLHPEHTVPRTEAEKEQDDITRVLNDLNMSAVNNRAFSLSKESNELVHKFTFVLKDIVNGAPHAYDDLVNLLEGSQGTLAKSYESMPSFLQKLVTTLPEKLTSQLGPELLAVAAEAQGLNKAGSAAHAAGASGGGLAGAAKSFLKPSSLKDLVTKPGAVAGMLKAIMNTLKLRWPAFMGTNVLLSLGLFVLLFVFWYCHKRGRAIRLGENGKAEVVDSEGRIVELDDDPLLADRPHGERRDRHRIDDAGEGSSSSRRRHGDRSSGGSHHSRHSGRSHRSPERDGHREGHREGHSGGVKHKNSSSRHGGHVPEQMGSHRAQTQHEYSPQHRNDTTERLDGLVQDARDLKVDDGAHETRDEGLRDVRDDRDYDRHDRHDRHEKRY